jgi:hypothetical protein
MKTFETTKAIAMMALTMMLTSGNTAHADEDIRCQARALQIEGRVLRCVASCRASAERRRSFNEERCLTKCESGYDEDFSRLSCAVNRRLVRELDAMSSEELREEARRLQNESRALRCMSRCDYSRDPESCVAGCEAAYEYASAMTAGELGDTTFGDAEGPTCTLSADGQSLECEYGSGAEAQAGGSAGVPFDAPEEVSCTMSADGTTLECN